MPEIILEKPKIAPVGSPSGEVKFEDDKAWKALKTSDIPSTKIILLIYYRFSVFKLKY
jgi:hypothetical protein